MRNREHITEGYLARPDDDENEIRRLQGQLRLLCGDLLGVSRRMRGLVETMESRIGLVYDDGKDVVVRRCIDGPYRPRRRPRQWYRPGFWLALVVVLGAFVVGRWM